MEKVKKCPVCGKKPNTGMTISCETPLWTNVGVIITNRYILDCNDYNDDDDDDDDDIDYYAPPVCEFKKCGCGDGKIFLGFDGTAKVIENGYLKAAKDWNKKVDEYIETKESENKENEKP